MNRKTNVCVSGGACYSGLIPVYEILKVNSLIREPIQAGNTLKKLISLGKDFYLILLNKLSGDLLKKV